MFADCTERVPSPVYETFVVAPATPDDIRYTNSPDFPDGAGPVAPIGPPDGPVGPVAPIGPPEGPGGPVAPIGPPNEKTVPRLGPKALLKLIYYYV
jgi:hypothetical protein